MLLVFDRKFVFFSGILRLKAAGFWSKNAEIRNSQICGLFLQIPFNRIFELAVVFLFAMIFSLCFRLLGDLLAISGKWLVTNLLCFH